VGICILLLVLLDYDKLPDNYEEWYRLRYSEVHPELERYLRLFSIFLRTAVAKGYT
jgi:hypothetical protein